MYNQTSTDSINGEQTGRCQSGSTWRKSAKSELIWKWSRSPISPLGYNWPVLIDLNPLGVVLLFSKSSLASLYRNVDGSLDSPLRGFEFQVDCILVCVHFRLVEYSSSKYIRDHRCHPWVSTRFDGLGWSRFRDFGTIYSFFLVRVCC